MPFGRRKPEEDAEAARAQARLDEEALLRRIAELEERLTVIGHRAERALAVATRIVKLAVPPAVVAAMLLLTLLIWPERFDRALARVATGLFFGKIAAIGGQEDFLYWLVLIGTLDIMIGLFFLWNIDLVHRIPWVGDRFRQLERTGNRFLEAHGWMRRVALVGVALIIAIPVQGTGSISGSILGRLLGLGTWRTFLALVVGGFIGTAAVLSGSVVAAALARIDPLLMAAFLVVVVVALLAIWWRFVRTVQVASEDDTSGGPGHSPPPTSLHPALPPEARVRLRRGPGRP